MNVFQLTALVLLSAGVARAEALVVLVDTSTEMPMADIRNDHLLGGMHKDVAEALAQRMGRKLEMLVLPRKRIGLALDSGRADMICLYQPEWLPGSYLWTQPFFPHAEIVLTAAGAPAPRSVTDLAGRPVGTIHGFYYPELKEVLGSSFVRDDGPSNLANLRKLAAGRVQHMATARFFYDYQLKQGARLAVHPPLVVRQYLTRCAVSPKGRVSLAEADAAITQILREGAVTKILTNYQ